MRVLGHRLDREPTDRLQRLAPDHRAGTAEERGVPEVVALLDQPVKELALVRDRVAAGKVPLERIGRIEVMRRLDDGQLPVAQEPADRHLQESAGRHMIRVEDGDQFAVGMLQRVVEVASLGVGVVVARDVAAAGLLGELAELLAAAVVEQPHPQLVARIVDAHRPEHGDPHQGQRFVVRRNVEVDRRPQRRVFRQGLRLAFERPGRLQIAEDQHDPGIHFRSEQAGAEPAGEAASA